MLGTIPTNHDIARSLRQAIDRTASTAMWYRSKAAGRRYGGDPVTADRYAARSFSYCEALSRLEDMAARLGLSAQRSA